MKLRYFYENEGAGIRQGWYICTDSGERVYGPYTSEALAQEALARMCGSAETESDNEEPASHPAEGTRP